MIRMERRTLLRINKILYLYITGRTGTIIVGPLSSKP